MSCGLNCKKAMTFCTGELVKLANAGESLSPDKIMGNEVLLNYGDFVAIAAVGPDYVKMTCDDGFAETADPDTVRVWRAAIGLNN